MIFRPLKESEAGVVAQMGNAGKELSKECAAIDSSLGALGAQGALSLPGIQESLSRQGQSASAYAYVGRLECLTGQSVRFFSDLNICCRICRVCSMDIQRHSRPRSWRTRLVLKHRRRRSAKPATTSSRPSRGTTLTTRPWRMASSSPQQRPARSSLVGDMSFGKENGYGTEGTGKVFLYCIGCVLLLHASSL